MGDTETPEVGALYVLAIANAKAKANVRARRGALWAALLWAGISLPGAAHGFELPDGLADGGRAVVDRVVDGDTVVLEDGRQVRLVGLQAPKLPLGRPDFTPWPLADEAKAALERLVLGRAVRLAYGGRRVDRHRRQLAHLLREDGLWVQGAMLSQGLARVYTFADNRALIPSMLAEERRARLAHAGIWRDDFYRVLDQRAAASSIGQFGVVEGQVLAVAEVRGRGYLNFGPNYRTDFTVTMSPETMRLLRREGIALDAYDGRRVRVRGWVRARNGPEQIEILTKKTDRGRAR